MAASRDGLHWSPPTPLQRCAVHGERTVHHPASGFLLDGDEVAIFIHENVPGVTADVTPSTAELRASPARYSSLLVARQSYMLGEGLRATRQTPHA